MSSPEERRSVPRVLRDDNVVVTILAAPAQPELVGTVVSCSTIDVSAAGLCLILPTAVAAGSRLGLEVEVTEHGTCYFLGGESMWSRAADVPGQYWVGVRLLDDQCFEMARWSRIFQP